MVIYPQLKAIVAVSENGVIGNQNQIPWHISEELKFFKSQTLHQIILMGRKTYESIGKPLPQRETWVLTRAEEFLQNPPEGVRVFRDLPSLLSAIQKLPKDKTVWVAGGASIYEQLLPYCSEIILSEIHHCCSGDRKWIGHDGFQRKEILCEHPDFLSCRWVRNQP